MTHRQTSDSDGISVLIATDRGAIAVSEREWLANLRRSRAVGRIVGRVVFARITAVGSREEKVAGSGIEVDWSRCGQPRRLLRHTARLLTRIGRGGGTHGDRTEPQLGTFINKRIATATVISLRGESGAQTSRKWVWGSNILLISSEALRNLSKGGVMQDELEFAMRSN